MKKNEKKLGKSASDTLLDCHNLAVSLVEAMREESNPSLKNKYLKEAMDMARQIVNGVEKNGECGHFSKQDAANWSNWLARKEKEVR